MHGAEALSLPTKYGQHLSFEPMGQGYGTIFWESYDYLNKRWFEMAWSRKEDRLLKTTDEKIAKRLIGYLKTGLSMTDQGETDRHDIKIKTDLEFPGNWGLGSSSTLLINLASFFEIDPFAFHECVSNGSGYDIAAGLSEGPIVYWKTVLGAKWKEIDLDWNFKDKIFFVHLGQKQDTNLAIAAADQRPEPTEPQIKQASTLTHELIKEIDFERFGYLMMQHEQLISEYLDRPTVKELRFKDYPHAIKSLGAWGGDFVMCLGQKADQAYFHDKGYTTIIPFQDLML